MPRRSPTTAAPKRRLVLAPVALATAVVLTLTACPGNVSHTYRTFQSAVDRGASCSELFDQRGRFTNEETLAKVDADLDRIGCTSADATRTDR